MAVEARRIQIKGQVQGVGFRPFVYNLAQRLRVIGSVANGPQGVEIFAQAEQRTLDLFIKRLGDEQPAMAQIESISVQDSHTDSSLYAFAIEASEQGEVDLSVTPDAAVCQDCLTEMFDPDNRRYQYPFINCTNCGPRYSLIKSLPYDRANTTMADFQLCGSCESEYQTPSDRRFHAQPNACADCGPELSFYGADGHLVNCTDPVKETLELIQSGKIVAVKGIGGFHLVCDARNTEAIERLRERKHRDEKPFAVMAANVESLQGYVELGDNRIQRLQTMDAAICLCPTKDGPQGKKPLPERLAPGLSWLGVMLPHSPLQYLLFHYAAGQPAGTKWLQQTQDLLLVMTSANRSGNPLVIDNHQALQQLSGIADAFLIHNREIYTRCDDSVLSLVAEKPALIRRGRGLSPQFIPLSCSFQESKISVLAVGGFFKNTVCLTKGRRAYVSQYIGDLDNPECCRNLNRTVEQLKSLLDIEPDLVVSDLHPDFYSSQFAREYAQKHQLPLQQVQHHHAHIAAVIAEHQIQQPVLGLALDGLGLGDDGSLWGGELLLVDQGQSQRLSSLSPLAMPGGERAAKEPWRMASAALHQLGLGDQIADRFSHNDAAAMLQQLLDKGLNCPETSSAGRLFDAVAGILGIKAEANYEAQAAMMLESLAWQYLKNHELPESELLIEQNDKGLNPLPLLKELLDCDDPAYGAALFHSQLIQALLEWVTSYAKETGISSVVLAGGCFLNQLLLSELRVRLETAGLNVYCPEKLPCNDGGLSLGQAQIALERALFVNNDNKKCEAVCA